MTRDMAVYLASYGIRVNAIKPRWFLARPQRHLHPAVQPSRPDGPNGIDSKEMKGGVGFLAS
jgi:NAD(P)-dependent dehydrogenase (short-subunit alcohol dehydrogenase family)